MKTICMLLLLSASFIMHAQQNSVPIHVVDSLVTELPVPKQKHWGVSFEMNYLRHYLWRGALFGNEDVAQPNLVLRFKNLSLGLLQNLNYLPKNVPEELYTRKAVFDEQDVTLGYDFEQGRWASTFSLLAYFYFFQIGTPNTAELINHTSFKLDKCFSIFTENSVDLASYRGAFYNHTGISFSKGLHGDWVVKADAYAGFGNSLFNQTYLGTENGGLNLTSVSGSLTKNLGAFYFSIRGERNQYMR